MRNTSFRAQMLQPMQVKYTHPYLQIGLNPCKTCGKETRGKLEFCSTDCQYWPHLKEKL